MRSWIGVVVCLAAMLPAPRGSAQEPTRSDTAEAGRLFRAGARSYDAGRFDVAVQAFDQAYELAARVAIRFSAAQALRRLYAVDPKVEHLNKALGYYRQYLAEVKLGRRVKDAAEAVNELQVVLASWVRPTPLAEEAAQGSPGETQGPTGHAPAQGDEAPTGEKPVSGIGTLQLDSATPGATATVLEHAPSARLPRWVDLPPGDYVVQVEAKGFRTYERRVRVMEGRVTVVDSPLEELPAKLEFTGDAGVDVLIDGRIVGRTPLNEALELPAGKRRILAGRSGHDVLVRDVELEPGETRVIQVDLGTSRQRTWALIVMGAAATMLATSYLLFELSRSREDEASSIAEKLEQRPLTPAEAAKHNGHVDAAEELGRPAGLALVGGILAAGVGFGLYVLDEPQLYEVAAAGGKGRSKAKAKAKGGDGEAARDRYAPTARRLSVTPLVGLGAVGPGQGGFVLGLDLGGRF